jgi:rhodanese-related sulfurtransferase
MRALAILIAVCAGLACGAPDSGDAANDVTQAEVLELVAAPEGPLLLDGRTPGEYASGHVPGAVNVPHDEVVTRLSELEPYRERGVVLYCQSGRRAGMATQSLQEAGFGNVRHLAGDMQAWKASGLPTEP